MITDVSAEHTACIFRVQVQMEVASSTRIPGNQVPDYMVRTSDVMFLGRTLLLLEELCTVYKSVGENAIVFCIDTNCVKMAGPPTVACERDFHWHDRPPALYIPSTALEPYKALESGGQGYGIPGLALRYIPFLSIDQSEARRGDNRATSSNFEIKNAWRYAAILHPRGLVL